MMTIASFRFMHSALHGVRCALAVLLLSMLLPTAHAAGEPLPMWEVRSTASKGAVYLLGSVHVCRESCLRFSESVLRRFRNSQALVLELDPSHPELAGRMMAAMQLPPGQTLRSKLSGEQLLKFKRVLEDLQLPVHVLDAMRPVMAEMLISMLSAQKQGLTVQNGIDLWFLQQAQAMGKPVRELETIERQLNALTARSEQEQLQSLAFTLDMADQRGIGPFLEELIHAWQAGDLTKLSQLMKTGMQHSKGFEAEIFSKRNAEMADKIGASLARGEETFVVIGAGHIAGDGNVAELLARKGYSVRQVNDGE